MPDFFPGYFNLPQSGHPQQPSEEVMSFPSAALTDFAGKWYFSFAMLPPAVCISALKDNCHDLCCPKRLVKSWEPESFVEQTEQTYFGSSWGYTGPLLTWVVTEGDCHTDKALSSGIHVPLFEIPWYLYKNTARKDQDNTENSNA